MSNFQIPSGYNNFNNDRSNFREDRPPRESSRQGRNWNNRDGSSEPERSRNFRGEGRNQQSSRWTNNQRQDEDFGGKVDDENENETSQQFTEEIQDQRENDSNEEVSIVEKNAEDVPPPGTDDYADQQDNSVEFSAVSNEQQQQQPPMMESFNDVDDDAKSNDNNSMSNNDLFSNLISERDASKSAVAENAGNTTPLCDENEARE